MEQPEFYYRENVDGMLSLLEAMADAGTSALVYSSSAAVWQPQRGVRQRECTADSRVPCTADQGDRRVDDPQQRRQPGPVVDGFAVLQRRGAARSGTRRHQRVQPDPHGLSCLAEDRRPQVFGDDYPTPDGSCIRDYIHVADLADAHVAAAAACERPGSAGLQRRSGAGVSVFEVMTVISEVVGFDVNAEVGARRAGDPAQLVALAERSTTTWDGRPNTTCARWSPAPGRPGISPSESVNRPRVVTSS